MGAKAKRFRKGAEELPTKSVLRQRQADAQERTRTKPQWGVLERVVAWMREKNGYLTGRDLYLGRKVGIPKWPEYCQLVEWLMSIGERQVFRKGVPGSRWQQRDLCGYEFVYRGGSLTLTHWGDEGEVRDVSMSFYRSPDSDQAKVVVLNPPEGA